MCNGHVQENDSYLGVQAELVSRLKESMAEGAPSGGDAAGAGDTAEAEAPNEADVNGAAEAPAAEGEANGGDAAAPAAAESSEPAAAESSEPAAEDAVLPDAAEAAPDATAEAANGAEVADGAEEPKAEDTAGDVGRSRSRSPPARRARSRSACSPSLCG